ncbi:SNF2-related protein [Pseudonocardia parietis]|uniref:N12 class adenine-specific DNA methylase/SAM-dependent methyltransferase n=1 Tax=Pseudonocardia parietis TaxID=570936 RepID=A0ABS4W593_9PSEU|nr:SNF2-related protein [Pseudonocardia parietis]MBP2371385.1 N12 class adenine-specific DNA methylase/SAM-dependent methyltransferase [Pseudonocardia parietis]
MRERSPRHDPEQAERISVRARAQFDAGELVTARSLIDDAARLDPGRHEYWARVRTLIDGHIAEQAATTPPVPPLPAAPRHVSPEQRTTPTAAPEPAAAARPGIAPDLPEMESDDPARFPDATGFQLTAAAANLLRIRITDVLESDPAQDDFYGGYPTVDGGTLRVHDKHAMLATIDNELNITDTNLRGPGRMPDAGDRRRYAAEEQGLVALRAQVAAMPDPPIGRGADQTMAAVPAADLEAANGPERGADTSPAVTEASEPPSQTPAVPTAPAAAPQLDGRVDQSTPVAFVNAYGIPTGDYPTLPAAALRPGDYVSWNQGDRGFVVSVDPGRTGHVDVTYNDAPGRRNVVRSKRNDTLVPVINIGGETLQDTRPDGHRMDLQRVVDHDLNPSALPRSLQAQARQMIADKPLAPDPLPDALATLPVTEIDRLAAIDQRWRAELLRTKPFGWNDEINELDTRQQQLDGARRASAEVTPPPTGIESGAVPGIEERVVARESGDVRMRRTPEGKVWVRTSEANTWRVAGPGETAAFDTETPEWRENRRRDDAERKTRRQASRLAAREKYERVQQDKASVQATASAPSPDLVEQREPDKLAALNRTPEQQTAELATTTVVRLHARDDGMQTPTQWSATISALPAPARQAVLAKLGFDQLDAMLEPAILAEGRIWRDELIERIGQLDPEIARLARDAAARRDAQATASPPQHLDQAPAPAEESTAGPTPQTSSPSEPSRKPEVEVEEHAAAGQFRPGSVRPPTGAKARVEANLTALSTLRALGDRPASAAEQENLARWSGWGAVPEVFDELRPEMQWARDQLTEMLDDTEMARARSSMLNAHYTDPDLAEQVWSAVTELGFHRGRVLEPGCGTGNYIGLAPDGAHVVGVEVESTTAAIAAALQPQAQIRGESFAESRFPNGSFDLVIGNVPFARTVLSDKVHNTGRHSIHNHFLIKSLHLTAPGGLVAAITSRYTLDARNPVARREMAELADLVGAIRLPQAAHQRTAGTDVITDLLVFRRREPGREPQPFDWELTDVVDIGDEQVRMNSWFIQHPEMLCGTLTSGSGQYSSAEPRVVSDRPAAELLAERLAQVVDRARRDELLHAPTLPALPQRAALPGPALELEDGHLFVDEDGQFQQVTDGAAEPFVVPKSRQGELRDLLELRDTTVTLLEAEAATFEHSESIEELRADLNRQYDAYADRYGPINRFKWRRTGRVDDAGNDIQARIVDKLGGFRADPRAPIVLALEVFDSSTGTATKADVFTDRVIAPRTPARGADTPAEALAICMDTHGQVELTEVARLLGVDDAEARTSLGELVFADPQRDGQLVPAAEYLSGHVRRKLDQALAAAEDEPAYAANAAALREVLPPDIEPEDIVARLGVPWIEASYVQAFLRQTLADPRLTVAHTYGTNWEVKGDDFSVAATSTWGTERYPAPKLAAALLAQKSIVVRDEIETVTADGSPTTRNVLNPAATTAAQAKADELAQRFSEWIWEAPQRATELARVYNDRFNSVVLRNYDDITLSLPGLTRTFEPNPHQYAAVARMISEPAVGLYHEVGAGKTAEMAIGVMELRRLGMVRKPCIVIPNHMIEQWSREFQQLYPRARILAASSADLRKDARRAFVARVATGDWDAVIITRGAFERIPMRPEAQEAYLDAELDTLREALERGRAEGSGRTVKRMQQQLDNAKERIKEKIARDYDPAVTFEATGIDYVVVDEAHDYKNLRTASNIAGAAIEGSNRAQDLDMKLHYLRDKHGHRVVTLATATPIANSITEAHVMQRYLRPDLLDQAGVLDFDAWAATFAATVSDIELSPDGTSFRMKARFARFHNVPELLRMWWVSGDVKTADDLNLPRPDLLPRPEDGQRAPRTFLVPATEGQQELISELGARAEKVQMRAVTPDIDNMLKISSEGRAGALDLRLLGRDMPAGEAKLEAAADEIARIHHAHSDDEFLDADGEPHPRRGGFQLVFCDLGTPGDGAKRPGWNVYTELRDQLVERGLPREQVRFIHEAANDRKKAELFEACRVGEVSVLIGSTSKMGVGTNVQARAVALHHLDCPWRPADLAQRDGRALRRGNQYSEIALNRYVVEGTFDAYMWQALARKASFISQLMNGRLDVREVEGDIGDTALNYNEVKALAAGNPLLMDKAKADAELTKLERLERSHVQTRSRLRYTIEVNEGRGPILEAEIEALRERIDRRTDTRGEQFVIEIGSRRLTDRSEAGTTLINQLATAATGPESTRPTEIPGIARLGGQSFDALVWSGGPRAGYELRIAGTGTGGVVEGSKLQLLELAKSEKPSSLVVRMENRVAGLDEKLTRAQDDLQRTGEETERATAQLQRPFAQAAELEQARVRVREIDEEMADLAAPAEQSTNAAESTAENPPSQPDPPAAEPAVPAGSSPTAAEAEHSRAAVAAALAAHRPPARPPQTAQNAGSAKAGAHQPAPGPAPVPDRHTTARRRL